MRTGKEDEIRDEAQKATETLEKITEERTENDDKNLDRGDEAQTAASGLEKRTREDSRAYMEA